MALGDEGEILVRVGAEIRRQRQANGLSLHELARLSGISGSALSLIETGKRDARLSTLDRIARSLGTGVGAFFDHPPQAAPAPGVGGGYDLDELE